MKKQRKSLKQRIIRIFIIICITIPTFLYIIGLLTIEYSLKRRDEAFSNIFDISNADDENMEESTWYAPGELEKRAQVAADVTVFLTETENSDVYIESYDEHELFAKVFNNNNSNLWVLILHGYGANHEESLDLAMNFYNQSYNVIAPDLRGHSNSGGEYITLGLHDQFDVVSWVEYILSVDNDAKIVLHGSSMGGASVLLASENKTVSDNVIAVVSDSSFTGVLDVLTDLMNNLLHISDFPFIYTSPFVIKLHTGLDFSLARPLDSLGKITIPIFFVHGSNDFVIPPQMVRILYDSYDGEKDILEVNGANHIASRYVDGDSYYTKMFNFLEKYE